METWSLLWTLIIVGSSAESCCGFNWFQKTTFRGVMKLVQDAWNLTPCLWKLKTRQGRFFVLFFILRNI
jgi:hypothetical protein